MNADEADAARCDARVVVDLRDRDTERAVVVAELYGAVGAALATRLLPPLLRWMAKDLHAALGWLIETGDVPDRFL